MHKLLTLFRSLLAIICILFTSYSANNCSYSPSDASKLCTIGKYGALATVAGFAVYTLSLFCYKKSKSYIEEKIIDEASDNIVLALTSNYTLEKLPADQSEKAFKQKSRLINMRKSVLAKLKAKLSDPTIILSQKHRDVLEKLVKDATNLFTLIDAVRTKNPYENDAASILNAHIDSYIEANMINSIIVLHKPHAECTPSELEQKEKILTRRAKIIELVEKKIRHIWYGRAIHASKMALLLAFLNY